MLRAGLTAVKVVADLHQLLETRHQERWFKQAGSAVDRANVPLDIESGKSQQVSNPNPKSLNPPMP